jgi:hypothetical protein
MCVTTCQGAGLSCSEEPHLPTKSGSMPNSPNSHPSASTNCAGAGGSSTQPNRRRASAATCCGARSATACRSGCAAARALPGRQCDAPCQRVAKAKETNGPRIGVLFGATLQGRCSAAFRPPLSHSTVCSRRCPDRPFGVSSQLGLPAQWRTSIGMQVCGARARFSPFQVTSVIFAENRSKEYGPHPDLTDSLRRLACEQRLHWRITR